MKAEAIRACADKLREQSQRLSACYDRTEDGRVGDRLSSVPALEELLWVSVMLVLEAQVNFMEAIASDYDDLEPDIDKPLNVQLSPRESPSEL